MTDPAELKKQEEGFKSLAEAIEQTELTRNNYIKVLDVLVQCKGHAKAIKEKQDEALKPAKETVKKVQALFTPALDYLADVEAAVKEKAVTLMNDIDAERLRAAASGEQVLEPLPKVKGISVRESWGYEVINAGLLSEDLLCPDDKAIKKRMSASLDAEGRPMPIPGVVFFLKKTLAVKA